jgi:hypothetical protein
MNSQLTPDTSQNILTKLKADGSERKEAHFANCQDLADQVLALLAQGDESAKGILANIENIYKHTTSGVIRMAIENCFMYRLSIQVTTCSAYKSLLKQLPKTLNDLLSRQLLTCGT